MGLEALVESLKKCVTDEERVALLERYPSVQKGLAKKKNLSKHLDHLNTAYRLVIESILAIGQEEIVFQGLETHPHPSDALNGLIHALQVVEKGYREIGGIVGYHTAVLGLLSEKACDPKPCTATFLHPPGVDISQNNPEVALMIRWGLENLPKMAEFYPIGGAGERLDLKDEQTGELLPVAELKFDGRTLLEGMIRDLEAREWLYRQLFGTPVIVPIVLMTSHEKNNRLHIERICREANWFGRGKDKFYFFDQPLVPVITKDGNWSLKAPLVLNLKPGGHGVLWKFAEVNGIFKKLAEQKIEAALVRQINNPIAGLDYGLLAFTGKGAEEGRSFGFASCERLLNTPEGVDVVIETPLEKGFEYTLTNVEYTEFVLHGIQDVPSEPSGTCSAYPSNTNILFANLKEVEKALLKLPFPGMLINMKSKVATLQPDGSVVEVEAGRLETTMQNIADAMGVVYPKEATEEELKGLPAFIIYNKRSKTISVAKSAHQPGKSLAGTPEGCYQDLLKEHVSLLKQCGFFVGEDCLISYHPALGPLYDIIVQKLRRGRLEKGAELRIDLAEIDIEHLKLHGSLQIQGTFTSKCTLKNVTVHNDGIDRTKENIYWKNKIERRESLKIVIEGDGEFFAEGVIFTGNWEIEVKQGQKVTAVQDGSVIRIEREKVKAPGKRWKYSFDEENRIVLSS